MSIVYDIFNKQSPNASQPAQPAYNPMINQLQQFAGALRGNPQQMVQNLLQSGRMSQQQFNQLSQQASQIQQMFGLR